MLTIYYVTNDLNNQKELNELDFLRHIGRLVVITDRPDLRHQLNIRTLTTKSQSVFAMQLMLLWSRFCLLLSKLGESSMDRCFPKRNIYMKRGVARAIVNSVWWLKNVPWINRVLPDYDTLYFAPLRLMMRRKNRPHTNAKRRTQRIFIHDALLVRMNTFAGVIAQARIDGSKTLANIKSWDNPFYSQLATGADGFLVWSSSMWNDVVRTHGLEHKFVHAWGARPFFEMVLAHNCLISTGGIKLHSASGLLASFTRPVSVGYAAAFGDEIMGRHEVGLLKTIASKMAVLMPNLTLKIRPYPTLGADFYADLDILPNVKMVYIGGEATDRFGDARELIRFGSTNERLDYILSCDVFLSVGTSFTIEAAICGLPVVHFQLSPAERKTDGEREIFQRIDICDHLDEYFVKSLSCAKSYIEVAACLEQTVANPIPGRGRSTELLRRMGVPGSIDMQLLPPASFLSSVSEWMNA